MTLYSWGISKYIMKAVMAKLKINKYRAFILSAFLWLAIDLLIKYFLPKSDLSEHIFIKNFLYFSVHTNSGVAFGIHIGYFIQLIVSAVILYLLIYFGFKYLMSDDRNRFINQALLGIIVGGAIGNMLNRITLGYVIDYIVLRPLPIFNFADIGITIGLIVLFLMTYNNK